MTKKVAEFYGHTEIGGKVFKCYTLFLVPVRTQQGDIRRMPAWVPNKVIRGFGLEHRLADADYMINLFATPIYDPENPPPSKRVKIASLYSFLEWNEKECFHTASIFSPGSKGVMTHTVYLPDSCLPPPPLPSLSSSEEDYEYHIGSPI